MSTNGVSGKAFVGDKIVRFNLSCVVVILGILMLSLFACPVASAQGPDFVCINNPAGTAPQQTATLPQQTDILSQQTASLPWQTDPADPVWHQIDSIVQLLYPAGQVYTFPLDTDPVWHQIDSVARLVLLAQGAGCVLADSLSADSTAQTVIRKPFMVLRTNLLYDAAVIPNIGVEFALGNNWAIGADWWYTWIYNDPRHFYWQSYGGYLTLRYYFTRKSKDDDPRGKEAFEDRFTGHHVGIYGSALTYDLEFGGRGEQAAKFGFGGGIEYGYSLRVARSLCIDFTLGVGYQGGEYKKYMPTDDGTGHYVWQSTHRRHWWGPTKAEISLKWIISAKKQKGGPQ